MTPVGRLLPRLHRSQHLPGPHLRTVEVEVPKECHSSNDPTSMSFGRIPSITAMRAGHGTFRESWFPTMMMKTMIGVIGHAVLLQARRPSQSIIAWTMETSLQDQQTVLPQVLHLPLTLAVQRRVNSSLLGETRQRIRHHRGGPNKQMKQVCHVLRPLQRPTDHRDRRARRDRHPSRGHRRKQLNKRVQCRSVRGPQGLRRRRLQQTSLRPTRKSFSCAGIR